MTKIIKNNVEIELTQEEVEKIVREYKQTSRYNGRFFFPKIGETFWYIDYDGEIYFQIYESNCYSDICRITIGVYRTKEEAEQALKEKQALVRVWKYAQEKMPFEPDWNDIEQFKFSSMYNFEKKSLYCASNLFLKPQNELPYLKSEENCDKFIEDNKEDLLTIFRMK